MKKIAAEKGVAPSEIDAFVDKAYSVVKKLRIKRLEQPPLQLWG